MWFNLFYSLRLVEYNGDIDLGDLFEWGEEFFRNFKVRVWFGGFGVRKEIIGS